MWMVDSIDHHGKDSKMSTDDPMFGRKLRPLMPRPISGCATKSIPFSPMSTASCFCTHNPKNILPIWNHPMSGVNEYGFKREIHAAPLVSTRWNPTPEQLQALEEMYRRGTRTPSAEQIQQIALRLRRFGKIEGKNVFYWFQNHKARERQKKRRQLELLAGKKIHNNVETSSETKQTGLSKRYFEIDNQKILPIPSNCSTPSEDSVSMQRAVIAECKKDVWTQLDHKEFILQASRNNEITSWKLDLSSCNTNNTITSGQENTKPFMISDGNIETSGGIKVNHITLQLFPIGNQLNGVTNDQEEIINHDHVSSISKSRPSEFIEFLPTKK